MFISLPSLLPISILQIPSNLRNKLNLRKQWALVEALSPLSLPQQGTPKIPVVHNSLIRVLSESILVSVFKRPKLDSQRQLKHSLQNDSEDDEK